MEFSFNQVKSLLDILHPFLVRGGIPKNRCCMPSGEILLIKPEKFIEAYDWLDEILRSVEWAEVQSAWKLVSPEMWANYDLFGVTDLAEQIILQDACVKLKELWKIGRPNSFFGKHIDVPETYEEETTDGLANQGNDA